MTHLIAFVFENVFNSVGNVKIASLVVMAGITLKDTLH